MSFIDTLRSYSPIPINCLDKMDFVYRQLAQTNKQMNLTATIGEEEAAILHFADSLYPLKTGYVKGNILDVGSGGGFPAFPIAIASGLDVTALDSTAKKLDFIAKTAQLAGIQNLKTLCGRAEELAHLPQYRQSFDTVIARGVARLDVLCELCLPYVKRGGAFIAMKGSSGEAELDQAMTAITTLGGEVKQVYSYQLPLFDRSYCLIIIGKTKDTPQNYPRGFGTIVKKPIKGANKK